MGIVKNQMMEDEDRGFYLNPEKTVCTKCFCNYGIHEFIESHADHDAAPCSFCSRPTQPSERCKLDLVVEHIHTRLSEKWHDPVHESPRVDGDYVFDYTDTGELLDLYGLCENFNLRSEIVGALETKAWCKKDYYSNTESDRLKLAWDSFCNHIKHRARYFFIETPVAGHDENQHDEINPSEILDVLGNLFEEDTIAVNDYIFRVRFDCAGANLNTKEDLGMPAVKHAKYPNRMSPVGIPMFYGAFDLDTAIKETYRENGKQKVAFSENGGQRIHLMLLGFLLLIQYSSRVYSVTSIRN